jgi:hypothetical protein
MTGDVSHCITNGSLAFSDGQFVFRGANGRELHGTHFGSFTATDDPNIFTFAGEITFTGGTGKLEGASGKGELRGRIDMRTGLATVTIDGSVTL